MRNSQNDLSGTLVKVDYEVMLQTAGIAYSGMRQKVENYLSELQHMIKPEDFLSAKFPLRAKYLAEDAERLAVAAEMYHNLLNGKTRERIEVVNKPEIKGA